MRENKCNWCSTAWKDIKSDNPGLDNSALAQIVIANLRITQEAANCRGKLCMPLRMAEAILDSRQGTPTPLRDPEPKREGFFMRRARQVVELKILDEVKGHPDKYTAFESARKCGCNRCVTLYNSWVDMWSQGDPRYDKFKKPLSGEKHVDW